MQWGIHLCIHDGDNELTNLRAATSDGEKWEEGTEAKHCLGINWPSKLVIGKKFIPAYPSMVAQG